MGGAVDAEGEARHDANTGHSQIAAHLERHRPPVRSGLSGSDDGHARTIQVAK
jgi:hypothetical protein